ncbi:2-succinyl-6-hydroxy-2,4-cyclohexadiene-1-carboxylate synthase [Glaesserella sp.]|uniref:2-succinyl-6-hydroxy-2, 4-cyclohexadiene-1-carboxylate synthase n=1 Tax=Glaesserella sp. TaxID=2094731 RepID=UPI00359F15E3
MLAYQWLAQTGQPVVFLHGLLGSRQDWADVLAFLQNNPQIRPLVIDLPFHGKSQNIECRNFAEIRMQLHNTLTNLLSDQPFWLVGYSLGGRIALDYALNAHNPKLCGTILEGTNIGLNSDDERQARWQNDVMWANRFRTEPLEEVLQAWYQQAVFADLSADKRSDLVKKRRHNHGYKIAQMLEATSLAKQTNYLDALKQAKNITFVVGERDQKFRQLLSENNLPYQQISNAGHNTHWENPQVFVTWLVKQVKKEE